MTVLIEFVPPPLSLSITSYSLHAVIKPSTFSASPLKTGGLVTSILDPVLDSSVTPPAPTVTSPAIRA